MSNLEEFAHTVQADPDEVFLYWWLNEAPGHNTWPYSPREAARAAFDLGRRYQQHADALKLAQAALANHQPVARADDGSVLDLKDTAAVHRESSRVPERFQEG